MPIQYINTGTSANAGNGDSIRTAFSKVNQNFDYVINMVGLTGTVFVSEVQDVIKPMLLHDAHKGLRATYDNLLGRIVFNSVSDFIAAENLTIFNTATFNDVIMTGTVSIGILQGLDDVSIVKEVPYGLNLNIRNMDGLGSSEITMIDSYAGAFNIVHQNSAGEQFPLQPSQNYIFSSGLEKINIGRSSNIDFFSDVNFEDYSRPAMSITNTGTMLVDHSLYVSSSTFYLNNQEIIISDKGIKINGTPFLQTLANTYSPILTPIGLSGFDPKTPVSSGGSLDLRYSKIVVEYPGQFNFLTGDFTFEWFQYALFPDTQQNTVFWIGDPNYPELAVFYRTGIVYVMSKGITVLSAGLPTYLERWVNIVILRKDGILKIYVNGVETASLQNLDSISSTYPMILGDNNDGTSISTWKLNGLITNFRVTNDAVYSSNFTVTTDPLGTTPNTKLLLLATSADTLLDDSSGSVVFIPSKTALTLAGKNWEFDENAVMYIPPNGDIVDSNGKSIISNQSLNTTSSVRFNQLAITDTAVPLHSYGSPGDVAGMIAVDGEYIYYCKSDYIDSSPNPQPNIWVRSAWANTTW